MFQIWLNLAEKIRKSQDWKWFDFYIILESLRKSRSLFGTQYFSETAFSVAISLHDSNDRKEVGTSEKKRKQIKKIWLNNK